MLRQADQLPDIVDDPVRRALRHLQAQGGWTGEAHRLYRALEQQLRAAGYRRFTGDCRDYHLQRKGDWCLYDVPADQRGALQPWRGQRVRLVCAGGWDAYSGRGYFAAPVPWPATRSPAPSQASSSGPT